MREFQLGVAYADAGQPVVGMYDFGQLASSSSASDITRATLVDVGGGQGQAILATLAAFPNLYPKTMILQDLAPPLEQAKALNHIPDGIQVMPIDFWTEQPVEGAKAYYIRRVLHDYSDAKCAIILTHVRDAMVDDSVLLMSDIVMPKKVSELNLMTCAMDCIMFVLGGKERAEEQWQALLAGSGFENVKVWRLTEDLAVGCVIEARKKNETISNLFVRFGLNPSV
jgi:O-methyltransferase domain